MCSLIPTTTRLLFQGLCDVKSSICLESLWRTTSQFQSVSSTWLWTVWSPLKQYTLSVSYGHIDWKMLHSSKYTGPWSSQGYFTQPVHGTVLLRQQIVDVLTYCWNVRNVMVTVCLLTFEELCDAADDQLFNKTVSNCNHVLHCLLPPWSTASQHYNLRRRMHTLSLLEHGTYLSDCNFVTHMLYKHIH